MGRILTLIKNKYKNNSKSSNLLAQKTFAIFALFFMVFIVFPTNTGASLQDDLKNVNDKIQQSQRELSTIRSEKNTLQGQVNAFNGEIANIEYQIALTNQKINLLNTKIAQTKKEIEIAKQELAIARERLSEFIRVMYEEGQVSTIEIIAKSKSFNEFVNRSEYMEQAQLKVKESADRVVALMNKLDAQQKELEADKKEAETLKSSQLGQRNEVSIKRNAKNSLLSITKGNEAEYQSLIKKLRAQQQQITSEIWRNSGSWVSLGKVNQGDTIGYQGNSGWSSGSHLHFEIRTPSLSFVDPENYIGNGTWGHPLPGAGVTCVYGNACYTGHKGTDYALRHGAPILASADGEIVKRVTGMGNNWPAGPPSYGNYVIIKHYNGWYTWYAHLI